MTKYFTTFFTCELFVVQAAPPSVQGVGAAALPGVADYMLHKSMKAASEEIYETYF